MYSSPGRSLRFRSYLTCLWSWTLHVVCRFYGLNSTYHFQRDRELRDRCIRNDHCWDEVIASFILMFPRNNFGQLSKFQDNRMLVLKSFLKLMFDIDWSYWKNMTTLTFIGTFHPSLLPPVRAGSVVHKLLGRVHYPFFSTEAPDCHATIVYSVMSWTQ